MKALQIKRPRSLELVEAPVPHLASGSTNRLLIRTSFVSMCGSDIPFYNGAKAGLVYPLPPGAHVHECVGEVIESTSDLFRPGVLVAAIPQADQGLAEFFVADAAKAARLPDELSACDTCSFIQPLSTVINAVDRLGEIRGRSIAVVGLGSIGLLFCWLLRRRGAEQIVGIDPCSPRCRVAERMGASRTLAVRSADVLHASHRRADAWPPPDVCIEAVGHQEETLNDCIALVREEGTVLAFGVPDQPVYTVEFERFFRKNACLLAVVTPAWDEYLTKARDLFMAHCEELSTLATHRFPIGQAGIAFGLYERREGGILKAVLHASEWEPKSG
jgi:threonine dehydrogenase-like Zn-dependent dehydrogenase